MLCHKMSGNDVAGFWGYARRDDEIEGGRVVLLSEKLKAEYLLITGEPLEIFVDRQVEWGEQWRARIGSALAQTTFFIPIITPTFFQRPECRKELIDFAGQAKSLGVSELLLPIYYIHVPGFGESAPDDAVSLVAGYQYVDWRALRLADPESPEYRTGVNGLATRLSTVVSQLATRPVTSLGAHEAPSSSSEDAETVEADEDAPGALELMAMAETTIPQWNDTILRFGGVMEEIATLTEESAGELSASDAAGRGFAGRVAVANRLAARLEEPSERMALLAQDYSSQLLAVNPGVLAMLRQLPDPTSDDEVEKAAGAEFSQAIRGAVEAARSNAEPLGEFIAGLDAVASMSRALRAPIGRIRASLRAMQDGQAILDEWGRIIDEAGY
jgi:hypothetical protein